MVFKQTKTKEDVLAEHQQHSHDNEIKCTGKDCVGKEGHIMKQVGENKVKCNDCGEERIMIKPHERLRQCPHCKEYFPKAQHFDECPYCGKEV